MIQRFKEKAVITTATITHTEKRTGYKSTYYLLHLQYKTIDTGIVYTGDSVSASKKHRSGDTVPLMYLAGKPAIFRTDFGKWIPWVLAFGIVFFTLIAWLCYWLLHLKHTYQPD